MVAVAIDQTMFASVAFLDFKAIGRGFGRFAQALFSVIDVYSKTYKTLYTALKLCRTLLMSK